MCFPFPFNCFISLCVSNTHHKQVGEHLFERCIKGKGMMGGGTTTRILTTHQLNFVERADRIAIMDRGRIVAVGTLRYVKRLIHD